MNTYLKPEEIANIISVDVSTVRRWLRDGEINYTKFGRAVRVKARDFEEYCRLNEIDHQTSSR